MYRNQADYDNATPPEDPPEAPCMEADALALLSGQDTDLMTASEFRDMYLEEVMVMLDGKWHEMIEGSEDDQ